MPELDATRKPLRALITTRPARARTKTQRASRKKTIAAPIATADAANRPGVSGDVHQWWHWARVDIVTTHLASGRRVNARCGQATLGAWPQAARRLSFAGLSTRRPGELLPH